MMPGSVSPFVLSTIRPDGPAAVSSSMAASSDGRVDTGETTSRRKVGGLRPSR